MSSKTRRPLASVLALAVGITALVTSVVASSAAGASSKHDNEPKPTIVLVHGAWAERIQLQRRHFASAEAWIHRHCAGQPTAWPCLDSAYLSSILATVSGPIVLVGHSYGGMVITNAATGNANIKALVYIAAFAPGRGRFSRLARRNEPGQRARTGNLAVSTSTERS